MSDIANLSDTITPKSDQLNADQLLGGPITITVTDVRRGSTDDQPVTIHYQGDAGRPYKPCKSMRKVLLFAWGEDGRQWIGRSMTLFNDPAVKWGGVAVGGVRISHLSHIDRDIKLWLAETKGKKAAVLVKRLEVATPAPAAAAVTVDTEVVMATLRQDAAGGTKSLQTAWGKLAGDVRKAIGPKGCPQELKDIAAAADAAVSGGEVF